MIIRNDTDHANALIRIRELMAAADAVEVIGEVITEAEEAEIDALADEIVRWEELRWPAAIEEVEDQLAVITKALDRSK